MSRSTHSSSCPITSTESYSSTAVRNPDRRNKLNNQMAHGPAHFPQLCKTSNPYRLVASIGCAAHLACASGKKTTTNTSSATQTTWNASGDTSRPTPPTGVGDASRPLPSSTPYGRSIRCLYPQVLPKPSRANASALHPRRRPYTRIAPRSSPRPAPLPHAPAPHPWLHPGNAHALYLEADLNHMLYVLTSVILPLITAQPESVVR